MTEESAAVQGNTESATDSGVQVEPVQNTDAGVQPEAAATPQQIKYDFKMPEGVTANQEAIDSLTPIMQRLGISQEDAQEIVSVQANIAAQANKAHQEAQVKTRESWIKNITADPELGGDKLEQTIQVANEGLNRVPFPGVKALLQQTGLGDHPDMIRLFHWVEGKLGDDTFVAGNQSRKTGLGMYENSPELK